ncbi:EamA family transporter [Pseudomonas sp. RIT-PI-AD]|uniref:EamA family transporter n=1 Tax=Pseudomonas sp. RIT-PI-AD TaxID=3035294 RepID=UPI0021D81C09|nr:EamA family transporter [Pseudomonas sp. RIT-PI-AD]
MSPLYIFATLLCVTGIASGQILFKQAAMNIQTATDWQAWVFNGALIAALCLYGFTTLFWIWILRHVPLYLAYPFMGLAFLIVPVLEHFFFGSPLHLKTFLGGGLILLGVVLAAST